MNTEIKNRSEIEPEYKWNIEKMYPDEAMWEKDLAEALEKAHAFTKYKGKLTESAATLSAALTLYTAAIRKAENAFVYARMKHDEDNGDAKYTEMNSRGMSVLSQVSAEIAFFTPELLEADSAQIESYISEYEDLHIYRYMIETILREKAHTLSASEERIISTLSEVLNAPDDIYTMLADADMVFGTITDENGNKVAITHGNFVHLLESKNRQVRKDAFETLYNTYKEHNNTISSLYNYNVKKDVILAKLRNYNSSLDASLSPENIPEKVYHNLIKAVHDALPSMHKYVEARKKALQLDELHMYDVYTPLVEVPEREYTFQETVDIISEALKPLGDDYVKTLRNGILNERWVDILENKGKTSGAYSFGTYDSDPYILMNFKGTLKDVFTLIHEGGHSMHAYYTRREQPYIYGEHSIFTAEVASTVNETLLIRYLLEHTDSQEMKQYLINFYIDEFKSTLFRQAMFAEFELIAHNIVEDGGSLTGSRLNEEYKKLNDRYFGPAMSDDDFIQYEWSRIPHFYRSYYVFQYATGYSAANALANRILTEGAPAVENYRKFLTLGNSMDPIDLLKIAGVDMSTEEPVQSALKTFTELVDELIATL